MSCNILIFSHFFSALVMPEYCRPENHTAQQLRTVHYYLKEPGVEIFSQMPTVCAIACFSFVPRITLHRSKSLALWLHYSLWTESLRVSLPKTSLRTSCPSLCSYPTKMLEWSANRDVASNGSKTKRRSSRPSTIFISSWLRAHH